MKYLIACSAAAALLLLGSCKKENSAAAPELTLGGGSLYEDTLKARQGAELLIPFELPGGPAERLEMSRLQGAIVYYGDEVLNNAGAELRGAGSGQLRLRPLEAGVHTFFVSAIGPGGESEPALAEVTAIDNWLPQAALQAEQLDEAAPYHVRISAAGSRDADERWGGGITAYRFTLEGFYTTETARVDIDYIFPGPGRYGIRLKVQDNDGAWSGEERLEVVVE